MPAHRGIVGNERADGIAKEATGMEKEVGFKVPAKDWRGVTRETVWKGYQTRIEREGSHKGVKFFQCCHDGNKRKPWFARISLERGLVNMINRLRSNHYNLNESLSKKSYINSPRCECGAEVQDINHLVLRCNLHDEAREELYRQFEREEVEYPYDVERWIRGPVLKPLRKVWSFFKKIKKIV